MFVINNASKYQDSVMYPHPLTDDTSYPHRYQLRNKLVSETDAEKLTENHLCLTCKSIQSPLRHHNKMDHLQASVYCLRDLIRLNCGLVLKLDNVYWQKNVCIKFSVVKTKTWTLVITKGLINLVSCYPKDPIFSFCANKCHFFFCHITFKLIIALCLFKLNHM